MYFSIRRQRSAVSGWSCALPGRGWLSWEDLGPTPSSRPDWEVGQRRKENLYKHNPLSPRFSDPARTPSTLHPNSKSHQSPQPANPKPPQKKNKQPANPQTPSPFSPLCVLTGARPCASAGRSWRTPPGAAPQGGASEAPRPRRRGERSRFASPRASLGRVKPRVVRKLGLGDVNSSLKKK